MSIRKGEDWGGPGPLAADAPVAHDDASAAAALRAQHLRGVAVPEVGLVSSGDGGAGDLHRGLGAPRRDEAALRSGGGTRYPVDVVEVEVRHADGRTTTWWALNGVVVGSGRRFWRGRWTAVMNGPFWGAWNLGPRAHPDDGRLDVVDGALGLRDRVQARRRAPSGTHVPHPDLAVRRVDRLEVDAVGRVLWVDRVERPGGRTVRVTCLPDAAVVVA